MFRAFFSRGVSASALSLAVSSWAFAQQTLPTIDVGGARRAASAQRGPAQTAAPATNPVDAPPPAPSDITKVPEEFRTPAERYIVRDASAATKANIPIKETPSSIIVIPRQVIRDQASTRLQEVVENVSGVRSNSDDVSGFAYVIRGFRTTDIFRNQLNQGNVVDFNQDTANVERIEVLKGPASMLYGRIEPGGLINIVTKKPLFQPRYVIEQQIGNYNHYRTQWDLSAPVKQLDGIAWRFIGAWTDSRFFRQFAHKSSVFFSPVVTYRPTEWTEFTADAQYYSNVIRQQTGIPAQFGAPIDVPIRRSYQEPNDPRDRTATFVASYIFRQKLDENWTLDHRFLFSRGWLNQNLVKPNRILDDFSTLDRSVQQQNLYGSTFSTNINLEGTFETFGANHKFLFGLDYLNRLFDYYLSEGDFNVTYPINLYFPTYGTVPPWAYQDALIGAGFKFFQSNLARDKGMYVQDQINFFDNRAHVLLGVRYDIGDITNAFLDSCCGDYNATKAIAILKRLANPTNKDTGWSPRYGMVFDVTPEVSVYGSFTRSFGLNNAPADGASAQTFPAQRGTQWEVGLKMQPLPGVTASLAFFQLTRSNLTTANFATPDPADQILAGLQRSRGIEFDAIGAVTDRLALVANYAYIDAKVIADSPVNRFNPFGQLDPAVFGEQGGLYLNHLDNVPRHSGKIFLTYDFSDNSLGWRVGGGVTAATRAWGDIQNTFVLPSWARLDAFASYTTLVEGHKVAAQLNLNNITNTRYFTGADNFFNVPARLSVFPAAPFTAIGTLKFEL